jgi:hypothetical protein
LFAELISEAILRATPIWHRPLNLLPSQLSHKIEMLASIGSGSEFNPPKTPHRCQPTGKRLDSDGKLLTELPLRNLTGIGDGPQQDKLRSFDLYWSEYEIVQLCDASGCTTGHGAGAV